MQKNYIIFDLDGTLIDSESGIFYCLDYTAKKMNVPPFSDEIKKQFIGPPIFDSFSNACGFDDDLAKCACKIFRTEYFEKGHTMVDLYDGILKLLDYIKSRGIKMYVATSKPEVMAQKIMDNLNISHYFDYIAGASVDMSRTTKIEVLDYLFDKAGLIDKSDCVLIGDTLFDAKGAKTAEIDFIGVLWGFGGEGDFSGYPALTICKTPNELIDFI